MSWYEKSKRNKIVNWKVQKFIYRSVQKRQRLMDLMRVDKRTLIGRTQRDTSAKCQIYKVRNRESLWVGIWALYGHLQTRESSNKCDNLFWKYFFQKGKTVYSRWASSISGPTVRIMNLQGSSLASGVAVVPTIMYRFGASSENMNPLWR